MRRAI